MILALAALLGYLGAIVGANWLTTEYGLIDVGFGLTATAGTWLAGTCFILRDSVQDLGGRLAVLIAIAAGACLSFAVADPFIAVASAVAFLVSELLDMGIYTPLREHGYVRAALASNIPGALVDTVLFLWIAGFPIWESLPGQMYVKVLLTLIVVIAVGSTRAVLRPAQR